ncbi:MAG: fatty acid desaturase [Paracoccaceae bacterium]|uniref:fatty acid desaturase n=1 Tax=Seohaeicola saemankumensis TaxID=481181 RepID=UPI001E35197F|nr:fatty acid desaturase [Seohaeicola saemankumensis]MCD1627826.1 fatty acid desaturase [Seohaeicola saemankumensis]
MEIAPRPVLPKPVEWPTLGLLSLCYLVWGIGTTWAAVWFLPLGMLMVTLAAVLHSSLCHEALHGHPFQRRILNEALVFPALSLCIPYQRFRDTHLAHHTDSILTDPYDDPESNYLDQGVWNRLSPLKQAVLNLNNRLVGRLLIGPMIGQVAFMVSDWRAIRAGDKRVLAGWLWHLPALALVVWWMVALGQMPVWAFVLSSYAALSILKIRTFLEHQAHARARGRTVIIEDRGLLAFLFLNNNLHVVHHMHPKLPWYRLPALYFPNRARYLARNDGYMFASYAEVFRRYLFKAKDPVPHPLWRRP